MHQDWLQLGVAYYPDYLPAGPFLQHLDKPATQRNDQIRRDLDRMANLGLRIIRLGEFSWSHVEPKPGRLNPDVFLFTLDQAARRGLDVIFSTPTATPPKWLSDLYPEILLVNRAGYTVPFGGRRHYDPLSPRYLDESLRITAIYADIFGHHPAVVGWQVDNEFGHHTSSRSFSLAALSAFRIWLEDVYQGDVDRLNEAYFNGFWSMNYQSFSEVELPCLTLNPPNPHLELDFYRFMTASYAKFQAAQIKVLREKSPDRWVTHNIIPMFDELCLWQMTQDLDVVGYDHYQTKSLPDPFSSASQFALMRSLKVSKFMVLEQQPLQVNWQTLNRRFAPDWIFLWGVQAAWSGASSLLYFSWQRFYGGTEQYHEGVCAHDVRVPVTPTELMIRAKGEFFSILSEKLNLKNLFHMPTKVLVVVNFESLWAHSIVPQTHLWRGLELMDELLQPLFALGIGVTMVPDLAAAERFLSAANPFGEPNGHEVKSILIPSYAFEWSERERDFLKVFVEQGGRVVSLPRTAIKTRSNGMSMLPLNIFSPEDFYFLDHGPVAEDESDWVQIHQEQKPAHPSEQACPIGPVLKARLWAEKIAVQNTEGWKTMASFATGLYEGFPAIIQYRGDGLKARAQSGAYTHFCFVPENSTTGQSQLLGFLGFEAHSKVYVGQPSHDKVLRYHWQDVDQSDWFGLINFSETAQEVQTPIAPRFPSMPDVDKSANAVKGALARIDGQTALTCQLFTEKDAPILEQDREWVRWLVPKRSVLLWSFLPTH